MIFDAVINLVDPAAFRLKTSRTKEFFVVLPYRSAADKARVGIKHVGEGGNEFPNGIPGIGEN
jgi:hypothetical protein